MSKREQNKEVRKNKVIDAAKIVFDEKGIEASKMTDIADVAEIGVASVYRYFSTKADIAMEVGINYWQYIYDHLKAIETSALSGLQGLKALMQVYTDDDEELTRFFRFIEQLDRFILNLETKANRLLDYEQAIISVEPIFAELLSKGTDDGSIKASKDIHSIYMMISHTLTSLKQKHCTRGLVLSYDNARQMKDEMTQLIEVFIQHLAP